jgi:hypothetical protein
LDAFFCICIYNKSILKVMQLQVRLEPQEVQFVIAAVNNTQIMGKDAHTVSSLLKKFEKKLEDIVEVK